MRRLARRAPFYAALAVALVPLGLISPVATSAASADCVTRDTGDAAARMKPGATKADPNTLSADQLSKLGEPAKAKSLRAGSVRIDTVYHVISDHELTSAERRRWTTMIAAQTTVLNQSFAGRTSSSAASTAFQFRQVGITWTVNPEWYTMVPSSSAEREAKAALRQGGSSTLNIYSANIGDGLLGWATFPQNFQDQQTKDGVVILDESMPGGNLAILQRGRHRHPRGRPLAGALPHLPERLLGPGRPGRGHRTRAVAGLLTARSVGTPAPRTPGSTRSTTSWTTRRTTAWTSSPPVRPSG